jgi:nucleotide-binding universal stress UspA family protein
VVVKGGTMEIKNVLVPTDFSVPSKMAVNYGVALARKFRTKLTLVHILDVHPLLAETATVDRDLEENLRDKARQELSALVSSEDQDDLDLRVVVKIGNVQQEITNTIKEQGADFIVLGTHGRGRVGRLILGSTTERLLRKLTIPVLTVRTTRPMNFKHILFATDLSESSIRGFDFALDLARTLQSKIVAIHALDKRMLSALEDNVAAETHEGAIQEASRKLGMLVTEGKRNGVEVEASLVEGDAAREILRTAEERSPDLILLAISRKGTVERALFGATAEQVVRESEVPVLSIPVDVAAERDKNRKTRG